MDIFQILPGSTGLPGFLLTIFAMIIGGWYILKRNKSQYEIAANEAQVRAIDAMKDESSSLRRRVEDVEKENVRLNRLIEGIHAALRAKKLVISVVGDMIDIDVEDNE